MFSSFHTPTYATLSSRVSGHTVQAQVAGNARAATTANGGANAPIVSQNLDQVFEDATDDWMLNPGVLGYQVEAANNGHTVATVNDAGDAPISGLDWIFADALDDLFPNTDVSLSNLGITNARAFDPTLTFGNLGGVLETYNPTNADFVDAWLAPTPPLTESDTPASTPSDVAWEGHVFSPVQLMTGLQGNPLPYSPARLAHPSQAELAWQFDQGHFRIPTPPYASGNGGVINPYVGFPNNVGVAPWGPAEVIATPLGVADIGHGSGNTLSHTAQMLRSERTSLGKRPRSEELKGYGPEELSGDQRPRPSKKVKGKTVVIGVLEAAGSTSSGPLKSKTPTSISSISEAAGRGAGRLAAPNAHEVYHQYLPGPSVQVLEGTTARGELPWVEGSEEEAIRHHTGSVVQPEAVSGNAEVGERENGESSHIRLPNKLTQRQRDLLLASPDELARRTVQRLKCRLCPKAGFGKFEDFKRHCKDSEAHPENISCCRYCGDFFARSDARNRHEKHRPRSCKDLTPAEAEAKRTLTKHVYDAFKDKFERRLANSEEAWTPFSQMVMAVLPNTSKRGSRQQCRIKASEA